MMKHGNRTITVNKEKLIEKVKENKENHIVEYGKAVVLYKKEALKQLSKLNELVKDGSLTIKLNLITPINNAKNYDDIIDMFEWDVEPEVDLQQREFAEYVQDETDFAVTARMSNKMYLG